MQMLQFSPLFASPSLQQQVGVEVRIKVDAKLQDSPFSFCSVETMQLLHCYQGAFAELHGSEQIRPTRIFISNDNEQVEFGVLLVSPSLAFNLSLQDLSLVRVTGLSKPRLPYARGTGSPTDLFPSAETITISRVRSDLSNGQTDYSSAIRNYFFNSQEEECQRVLRVGDVFMCTVAFAEKDDTSEEQVVDLEKPITALSTQQVPFQVTQINDNTSTNEEFYSVCSSSTVLKLVGSVSSAIPPQPDMFCIEKIWNVLHTSKPRRNSVLICSPVGSGKRSSVHAFARKKGWHYKPVSLTNCRGLAFTAVQEELTEAFREASQMQPCVLQLSNFEALMVNKQRSTAASDEDQIATLLTKLCKQYGSGVTVVALSSTVRLQELPSVYRSVFLFELELALPDLDERVSILTRFLPHKSGEVREIAQKTAGKSARELKSLVSLAAQAAVSKGDKEITIQHLLRAIDLLPNVMEELSGAAAPKIPEVKWDDVGGLQHAKEEILDMVQMPLRRPELFQSGMRSRSGILLFGPPGTGKTLLAKAVATECAMNFISVKGPELLDMYIGESERKVRAVFETARAAKPCVLFFDELDSLAPQRGKGSDSGGVMDRVVSQLLTEIDSMSQGGAGNSVFIIGATNRPDLLDSSLLRPGRFDRLIYLGICQDVREQAKVCRALTRKYVHEEGGVDFERVLESASRNLTGADFYALCSDAMAMAMKRKVDELTLRAAEEGVPVRKMLAGMDKKDLQVVVGMQDYVASMAKLIPSVSETELVHYETLRQKFSTAAASAKVAAAAAKVQVVVEEEEEEEDLYAPAAGAKRDSDDSNGYVKVDNGE